MKTPKLTPAQTSSPRPGFSRRRFLQGAGAALVLPTIVPARVLGQNAPSKQITVGFIGTGSHGIGRNLKMFLQQPDARAVAVCDVFRSRMEKAKQLADAKYGDKGCTLHGDFREILARKDIDAVMISTPDHWHALISAMALRAGKDVICEKPTLTIAEGRYIADLVKKTGKVFQTSTEDRSYPIYHRLAELVRNQRIGKLERIEVTLPDGTAFPHETESPVPADLNYDLWLGPAPLAPHTANRTAWMHWRHIFDYSGGILPDWGMHLLDTAQWANDTERSGPVEIQGKGTVNEGSMFNTFITYDVEYRYANGVHLHVKNGGTGIRFYGSKGWVGNKSWNKGLEASAPEILESKIGPEEIHLFTCPGGEHRNFLDCVKSRQAPYFPAEIGHRCATLCHLGNIAMQTGRKLRWDPVKEEFPNDAQANASAMRQRPMRAPWSLEHS
ncbi:MAG: Gfo/Idh/MocA family oxidoreductase [Limisphaerales bacterium]